MRTSTRCSRAVPKGRTRFARSFKVLLSLIAFVFISFNLLAQPYQTPTLNNINLPFNIDGQVVRQTSTYGDWTHGTFTNGTLNGAVFTDAGVPQFPLTYHIVEFYNSTSDTIFSGGDKVNDDPRTWGWVTGKPTPKDDINNVGISIAKAPNGDTWAVFSGDRYSTVGTSYIDFEFLQHPLTLNNSGGFNVDPATFSTGGRTPGDLQVTLEYVNGGGVPHVFYFKWANAGTELAPVYDWVSYSPLPANTAYSATNAGSVDVPYGAFGNTTYDALAFVEGGVNLSALISASNAPCTGLNIKTILAKSKSSASDDAQVKDLVTPIQVNVNINLASISYGGPYCAGQAGTATVTFGTGSPTNGTFSATPAGLTIDPVTGTINLSTSQAGNYTVNYHYNALGNNCPKDTTASVVITAAPSAPGVTVVNNCDGSSDLTATGFTGTLLWSNGATTTSIHVTSAGTYTVTQTVNGCTSAAGSGTAAPKTAPGTPGVTVVNNCDGTSTLTATGLANGATILWSTGQTINPITVNSAGTYTVTQTVNGCTSAAGSGTAAPKTTPSAPGVTVVNNCNGTSTLTATGLVNGATILWSTGQTINPITVNSAGTYTVTQTVNSCTSAAGSGNAAPKTTPGAPGVSVVNNCNGTSTLTATGLANGATILWSTGQTINPITVNSAGTYTVTQTLDGCTSAAGSGTAAPNSGPSAPGVTVVNNCDGTSTLTATGLANGATLLWSTSQTINPITVNSAGTYTVTQTVNGCTSPSGSGIAAPKTTPGAPGVTVVNNCGSSTLTATGLANGATILWSTGQTINPITVNSAGTYTVTQTLNGCTSAAGSGTAAPKSGPSAPGVTVVNNCDGSSDLTATGFTGTLLWSNGATTTSIHVTSAGTYTVTQTVNGCTSAPGSGTAAPKTAPGTPTADVTQPNCATATGTITITSGTAGLTFNINGGAYNNTTGVFAGLIPGTYTITAKSGDCVSGVLTKVVNPQPNCLSNCSYTQGYYGNKNGAKLLPTLLGTSLTVGRTGYSVTIPVVGGAGKLNSVMPGGTTPTWLNAGDCDITTSCFNAYLVAKTGKIGNVLLSQTITLALNTRLNGGSLLGFGIQSGWLTTIKGSCATNSGAIKSYLMNQNVVNYLTNWGNNTANVQNLLDLANDVLGHVLTPGDPGANGNTVPSFSDINNAVDVINNAFDECRTSLGYFDCQKSCLNINDPCPQVSDITMLRTSRSIETNNTALTDALKVSAHPNPFRGVVKFTIESQVSGQAQLEVVNMLGQKVAVLYNGYIQANKQQMVEYNLSTVANNSLIYILKIGGRQVTGKLIKE